ncbi:MAG: hypothetical protein FK734_11145 [Asgard group archaeon]|nr:hypothetical protein [Asgard group archaeon]
MVTAYQVYFLSISIGATIFSNIFVFLLFRQFIKKKTLGTIILWISFLFVAIAETFTAIGQTLYVVIGDNDYTGHLEISFVFCYGLAYVFFYYFSNRHILQDKDFLKAVTTIFSTAIVSLVSALMFSEIINEVANPNFYDTVILVGPNVIQYLPKTAVGLIMYIPIFIMIHIRIVLRLLKIRRDLENPITKRGFTFILYSVMIMVLSTLISSFYLIPGVAENAIIVGFVHSARGLTAMISIILGYFGWIMPDWLKKRIRGKAWIVKQMSKEFTAKIEPIASSSTNMSNVAVEISEQ